MKTTILTAIALATLGSASAIPGMHDMREDPNPNVDQVLGAFYGATTKPKQIGLRLGTVVINKEQPSDFGPCIDMVENIEGKDDVQRAAATMRARNGVTCVFFE